MLAVEKDGIGWLQVLRKFMDVFSTFDWDNKALSLQGPIPLSAFDDPEGVLLPFRRPNFHFVQSNEL